MFFIQVIMFFSKNVYFILFLFLISTNVLAHRKQRKAQKCVIVTVTAGVPAASPAAPAPPVTPPPALPPPAQGPPDAQAPPSPPPSLPPAAQAPVSPPPTAAAGATPGEIIFDGRFEQFKTIDDLKTSKYGLQIFKERVDALDGFRYLTLLPQPSLKDKASLQITMDNQSIFEPNQQLSDVTFKVAKERIYGRLSFVLQKWNAHSIAMKLDAVV